MAFIRACAEAEALLLAEMQADQPREENVRDALAALLDRLLETLAGVGRTDGLAIRRYETSPSAMWVLGMAYTLEGTGSEPVWFEFSFGGARDAIISTQVLFGIRDADLGRARRSKLETLLVGYPSEAKAMVPWRLGFTRDALGWERIEW